MKKDTLILSLAGGLFAGFLAFWAVIALNDLQGKSTAAEVFSALYGSMALFGGIVGLRISKHWGGTKSLIGRSVLFISLGILAQVAGQLAYSAYTYLFNAEIPYPSIGDIGYFGSVILYCLAAWTLIKAVSAKSKLRQPVNRALFVVIPLVLITISYVVFLRGYAVDFSKPLALFLDFGYPIGQAIYVSFALLALLFAHRYMGGLMRPVILTLLFALCLQFAADFVFLYQANRETWKTAGINELQYLIAYFVMTVSLVRFDTVYQRINGKAGR